MAQLRLTIEGIAKEVRRKLRRARWALRISLVIFLASIIFAFQPIITVYCWLTETSRTQFKFSSGMREPIRNLFEVWETTDDVIHSDSAQMLVDLIGRELPKGATIEDVNEHIRRHYRKGVDIFDGT